MTDQLLLSPHKHHSSTEGPHNESSLINNSSSVLANSNKSSEARLSAPVVSNVHQQKTQLKNVESEIQAMQHRIMLLRQQEQKEKLRINKHQERTKELIEKKLQVNQIQKLKQRDTSKETEKLEQLKRRNLQKKEQHEKEMNTILQACYLVKLDEARELKSLSIAHQRKIQEIKGEIYEEKKAKQTKIKQISQQSKHRYREFWKDKLRNLYSSQERSIQQVVATRQEKEEYLRKLQEEEVKMLERLGKIQEKSLNTKREYVTALNIPAREVGEVAQKSADSPTKSINRSADNILSNQSAAPQTDRTHTRESQHWSLKLPKTNLNEAKLRMILSELKKNEVKQSASPRRESNDELTLREIAEEQSN